MSKKRILLVEDNAKLQAMNKSMLEKQGFSVNIALTLSQAWELLDSFKPDAIILDRGMPDGDGADFLAKLRENSRIPVVMLTGYKQRTEVQVGYDSGCDDYITKPFDFDLLVLRLNILLKRAEEVPETLTRGGLTLKLTSQEAFMNGVNLRLPPNEYKLLQFFIQNERRELSGDYLYESVWGQPMIGAPTALRVAVSHLRKKLADSGYFIITTRGSGYSFESYEP
jgi:DNA-binding response OmpR family regulator